MAVGGLAIKIREARLEDAEAISAIYNYYVESSTCTFELSLESVGKRREWLTEHFREGLPVVVVEKEERIVGWASLSYYHSRCAYRQTVEPSIYVDHLYAGQGLGTGLTRELINLARQRGYHCLVGLACSENLHSIAMCQRLGFSIIGELKEVGRKFDRWLNVTILELLLE